MSEETKKTSAKGKAIASSKAEETKKTSANTAAEASKAILTTKEILEQEEKVNFYIPLEPGEKAGAVESVTINGYRTEVKKGVMQMLPKSIVAMLAEHYRVSNEAGKEKLINRDEKTLEALS